MLYHVIFLKSKSIFFSHKSNYSFIFISVLSVSLPINKYMKKRGRSNDQALLRTTVNKKMQTFSHKRLMKDL